MQVMFLVELDSYKMGPLDIKEIKCTQNLFIDDLKTSQ